MNKIEADMPMSKAEIKKMLKYLAEGDCVCRRKPMTVQELAGYFCVSRPTIYKWMEDWGIKRKCQINSEE